MSQPRIERPDLPEFVSWDGLEQLPEEIAAQIELWDVLMTEGRIASYA